MVSRLGGRVGKPRRRSVSEPLTAGDTTVPLSFFPAVRRTIGRPEELAEIEKVLEAQGR